MTDTVQLISLAIHRTEVQHLGMQRLRSVDIVSAVKVFAVFYCVLGVLSLLQLPIGEMDSIKIPLGFYIGQAQLVFNISLHDLRSSNLWLAYALTLVPILAAISGAITGLILALLFNWFGHKCFNVEVSTTPISKAAAASPFDV